MSASPFFILKLAILLAVGFAAGWLVNGWRLGVQIFDQKILAADTEKARAEKAASRLSEAQQRGDRLAFQVNDLSNTLTLFAEEKNHEIARLATGRRCLDAGLVRVLNRSPNDQSEQRLPEAAGQSVRAAAATAADPDDGQFATDADIAGWANLCRTRYDTCRGRLDAIDQFYAGEDRHGR